MFFFDSRPDRKKRDPEAKAQRIAALQASPVPPAKPYVLLPHHELNMQDRTLVFDCESFPNYFLVSFKCLETSKVMFFEDSPEAWIDTALLAFVMHRFRIVGFNSEAFDVPLMQLAMQGEHAPKLHEIAMLIIRDGMSEWDIRREFKLKQLTLNHIDLIDVAPLEASLKIYAGRLHCNRMQDLPFDPGTELTKAQAEIVRDYNINDLDNTALLFNHLKPQIELREHLGNEYDQDLRSKSDAQIAEAIIGSELDKLRSFGWEHSGTKKVAIEPGWQFRYRVPDFLTFKTPQLQAALATVAAATFIVGNGGYADVPAAVEALKIGLGGCIYRMGGGGLHTSEKAVSHYSTPGTLLIDRDVASYYPAIILNQGLYPSHLGQDFLKVYQTIVTRRLKAKLDKQKTISEALKITINGTFGKLGNFYSRMYSPDLLMQVTMSGQLCLLMLIEMIELAGIPIVSANTDGVVIMCKESRYADLENVILTWEGITGFQTEETRYRSMHCRDVNNYIAVKLDGECKTKGIYSERGSALNSVLSKNPECLIISDALQALFAHNKPLAETIYQCANVRRFVSVRTVKGGAVKDGVYLGKAIRWYYAQGESGAIHYKDSGNKVPKSEGARPLMELPAVFPADLDYTYYIKEAEEALFDLGVKQRPGQAKLL